MRQPRHYHQPDRLADTDLELSPKPRIDEVVRAQLRQIWWRLRRQGVRLPAEPGVIVVDKRRPSDNPSLSVPAIVEFHDEVGTDG